MIPVAVSESEAKCLEASDVTGQFEYSENSQNAEYLSRLRHPLESILGVEKIQEDRDEEGQDAKQNNDV